MRVRERWELRVPAAACARACACAMRVGVLAAARAVRDVFERVGAAGVLCDGCVGAVPSTAPDRIAHAHARARTTASAHIRARTHARAHTCAHAQHIHSARTQTHTTQAPTHNTGTHSHTQMHQLARARSTASGGGLGREHLYVRGSDDAHARRPCDALGRVGVAKAELPARVPSPTAPATHVVLSGWAGGRMTQAAAAGRRISAPICKDTAP